MDKALEILEQYCQWIAVGIGGLFLGLMAWTYGLMTPVSVPDGSSTVTPGEVDDAVNRRFAQDLKTAIDNTSVPTPPADKATILTTGDIGTLPPPTLAGLSVLAFDSRPAEIKKLQEDNAGVALVRVTQLPTVPPSTVSEALAKRATIDPAVQNVAGQPPVTPAAAPAGPSGTPVAPKLVDINYARISYTIDPAEIDKAFAAQKVPNNLTTSVLAVQLMRQEQKPDGTWTDAVAVSTAKVSAPTWQAPDANVVGPAAIAQFRTWAENGDGQTAILRPAFYTVTLGEGPWDPSMDDQLPKYDPKAVQKELEEKRKAEQEKRKAATPPRTTTPPRTSTPRRGGGGGGGAGGYMPDTANPTRPADLGALIDAYPVQAAPPANADGAGAAVPTPPAVVAPGQGQPPADKPLPVAPAFAPSGVPAFLGWAYDETVVEGHTYRYQVLYSLRNPIYDTNLGNPPALGQQFAITSTIDENAWSQPVEVKPSAEYYLSTNNWQSVQNTPDKIKIAVFKWALGKWQSETFEVRPGDKIGGTSKAGVDFNTNATVVDLRYDTRGVSASSGLAGRSYVLLLTADGRLVEREPTADRSNNRMLQLQQAIQVAQSAATAAGGAAGGAGGTNSAP